MSKTQSERICKECKISLELTHPHRVFCKKCMEKRIKKRGQKYYHDHRRTRYVGTVHKCTTCKNEFVYERGKTKFLKICNGCITRFRARIGCMSCIFCERPIKLADRGSRATLFCSKKCSARAWYLVKATKSKKIVLTK